MIELNTRLMTCLKLINILPRDISEQIMLNT